MKHLFLMATLLLSIFCIKPANSEPLVNIANVVQKMERSVFIVESKQASGLISKGSAVCVKKNDVATWFLTAKHVIEKTIGISLIINGKNLIPDQIEASKTTDCAFLKYNQIIEFVAPIEFNLEFDVDKRTIPTIAYGFWGGTNKLSATLGYTSREVCKKLWLKIYDYQPLEGIIFGQSLLWGGYSGGPLTDDEGRFVGLNIVLSSEYTMYVDSRYIWNMFSFLNENKKAIVPYAELFNIYGPQSNKKRLYLPDIALIKVGTLSFTVEKFSEFLDVQTRIEDIHQYLNKIEVIFTPGSIYNVVRVELYNPKIAIHKTLLPIFGESYFTGGGKGSTWVFWVS